LIYENIGGLEMPNVEFFGLAEETALYKIAKIKSVLKGHPCLHDMVFTIHEAKVIDQDEQSQPFIRLTSTPRKDIPWIIRTLKTLDLDIEHLELKKFIPAKK